MSVRNEIVKEALATESRWRALGYDINGLPTLMGEVDYVGAWIAMVPNAADRWNNRITFEHWTGSFLPVAGISGSWGYSGDFMPLKSSLIIQAFVDGIATDFSQGYGCIMTSKWTRDAAGVVSQIGATAKQFEVKDNGAATSGFVNTGGGSMFITFNNPGKVMNWEINAIYSLRTYP